ncbi:heme peroxidase [Antrihabitans spumae]|uniref:Heme peroxidase n=1 Tax=Antrihabitans spumae TaxID=3373370 RepID=A0ABW7K7P7_9NOCA
MDDETGPAELLLATCTRDLGDPDLWITPDGYPDSLALCLIDSIYSTGAHYTSVLNVVRNYRDYRRTQAANADSDGAPELLTTIGELGGPDGWATKVGNRRPTSTAPGAPLKAAAIASAAETLVELGIETTSELRAAAANGQIDAVKQAWRRVPGQRSGLTWEYALMLAQIPGVKADRMVIRYTARAIGLPESQLSAKRANELVRRVAEVKGWNIIHTDHAIWRFESGRQVSREADPI